MKVTLALTSDHHSSEYKSLRCEGLTSGAKGDTIFFLKEEFYIPCNFETLLLSKTITLKSCIFLFLIAYLIFNYFALADSVQ